MRSLQHTLAEATFRPSLLPETGQAVLVKLEPWRELLHDLLWRVAACLRVTRQAQWRVWAPHMQAARLPVVSWQTALAC